jgi:DNA (cytosine-5)-methyltransferase 1
VKGEGDYRQRISVAEASVLQSFPPDYPWQGTRSRQYLHVGNAIPPLMAGAILQEIATDGP